VAAVTTAEIFATISAADPSLGQIPQNHSAFLELLCYSLDEAQKRKFLHWRCKGQASARRWPSGTAKLLRISVHDFPARARIMCLHNRRAVLG